MRVAELRKIFNISTEIVRCKTYRERFIQATITSKNTFVGRILYDISAICWNKQAVEILIEISTEDSQSLMAADMKSSTSPSLRVCNKNAMRARHRDRMPRTSASRSDNISETVRLAFGRATGLFAFPYESCSLRRRAVIYIPMVNAAK
jgi:hypothetical protein